MLPYLSVYTQPSVFLQRLLPCAHPLARNPFRTGQFFTFALLPSRTLGSANKNFGWGWQRAATPAPWLLAGWDWHLCTGLSPVRDSLKTGLCAAGKGKIFQCQRWGQHQALVDVLMGIFALRQPVFWWQTFLKQTILLAPGPTAFRHSQQDSQEKLGVMEVFSL